MKQVESIIITHLPISTDSSLAFKDTVDDRTLINAICEYRKELEREGVEVFERKNNVIATEKGYFFAFFEKDLDHEIREEEVKPFKDVDGRMKVILVNDKTGKPEIKDLAELVAVAFLDNPNHYKYIRFIDGNKENCKAENLEWTETEN